MEEHQQCYISHATATGWILNSLYLLFLLPHFNQLASEVEIPLWLTWDSAIFSRFPHTLSLSVRVIKYDWDHSLALKTTGVEKPISIMFYAAKQVKYAKNCL